MADTLLHLTLANRVLAHPNTDAKLVELVQPCKDDYLMGSVCFDLPYYDQLLLSGIDTIKKRPMAYHPFGTSIHEKHAKQVCVSLVKNATTHAQFAIACGALCHFAVDIVFHYEIERLIAIHPTTHDELEREMGLHCHYDLLGNSGVGTPYTRKVTFLEPTKQWATFVCNSMKSFHQDTPTADTFIKWQRSFRVFGVLYSSRFFPWLRTLAKDDDALAKTSLELMNQAISQSVDFLNQAVRCFHKEISVADFAKTLPSLRMSDGLPESQ